MKFQPKQFFLLRQKLQELLFLRPNKFLLMLLLFLLPLLFFLFLLLLEEIFESVSDRTVCLQILKKHSIIFSFERGKKK